MRPRDPPRGPVRRRRPPSPDGGIADRTGPTGAFALAPRSPLPHRPSAAASVPPFAGIVPAGKTPWPARHRSQAKQSMRALAARSECPGPNRDEGLPGQANRTPGGQPRHGSPAPSRRSWPQAASMSRPRLRRTWALTPARRRISWNVTTAARRRAAERQAGHLVVTGSGSRSARSVRHTPRQLPGVLRPGRSRRPAGCTPALPPGRSARSRTGRRRGCRSGRMCSAQGMSCLRSASSGACRLMARLIGSCLSGQLPHAWPGRRRC